MNMDIFGFERKSIFKKKTLFINIGKHLTG